MIDLRNITEEQMEEYELEWSQHYGMDFINIKGTDFWVLGIDETTNTIYAHFDYGEVSWNQINWLADEGYCITGTLNKHISGLYDSRDFKNLDGTDINEAYDYVDDETVFIIKKGGENL